MALLRYNWYTKVKNPPAKAGDARDMDSIPGLGRLPGVENGNPLQRSCLENPMDRGVWWATVYGAIRVRHDWTHNTLRETWLIWIYANNLWHYHHHQSNKTNPTLPEVSFIPLFLLFCLIVCFCGKNTDYEIYPLNKFWSAWYHIHYRLCYIKYLLLRTGRPENVFSTSSSIN